MRKDGASEAERAMLNRVLNGLRYKYEEAGPIWRASTSAGALLHLDRSLSCRPAADSRPAATRPVAYSIGFAQR
jgi:hypothetical protein